MSQYTTGELAKLAGVTVRTVQYYDSRGILIPSDFSEGGRRLYTDEDLRKLKLICYLRELGIQINSIGEILSTQNAEEVISLLLEQQLLEVQDEIAAKEKQRNRILDLRKEMKQHKQFSIEQLSDIACIMENKEKMKKVRGRVLILGIITECIETGTFVLGLLEGIWWPFFIGLVFVIGISAFAVLYYYKYTAYLCPECHTIFQPTKWEFFWANHTPTTRKLHCTHCGHHGFCVEVYQQTEEETKA